VIAFKTITQKYQDDLTHEVVGTTNNKVRKKPGRELLESVYHEYMIEELTIRKINFHTDSTKSLAKN